LAALGFLLTTSQNDREQRREDQRAALQCSTAAEAAREEALSAYFRQMSALLLERELMTSGPNAAVRTLARTMTLGVLRRLDCERRTSVVRLLYEGRLLMRADPKVELDGANLAGVHLSWVKLRRANLRLMDLREADLAVADLRETDLRDADLREADLRGVNLKSVDWGADTRWPSGFDRKAPRRLGRPRERQQRDPV
jgi:Pentapeptide repeats (8 copies)